MIAPTERLSDRSGPLVAEGLGVLVAQVDPVATLGPADVLDAAYDFRFPLAKLLLGSV
jgi:hypothetical protein